MQKINPKPHYDVAIIGAGVGGLTAGALLSKAGFTVCILEKEPHAGGYLAGFRRHDFRFDTAIHWLNQYGPEGMVSRVFHFLGNDYPKAKNQKSIRRYKSADADYILTDNPDELKLKWQYEFPEDKEGIERFFKAAKNLGKSFYEFGKVFRTEETMGFFEKMANKRKLLKFALPFIPYIRYSGIEGTTKGLNKFFNHPKLHAVFSSEPDLLSCLVPIGWAYYKDFQSPPEGGSQVIPEWLCHIIAHFKNDIFYKSTVKKLNVENHQVKSVEFESRGKVYAINCSHVIAACDVETLYEKLLPQGSIPEKLLQKLRRAKLYSSSITLSLALDCPAEKLGFGEEMIHLYRSDIPRHEQETGDPEKCSLSILSPSYRDPSMAPEGQGTLTVYGSSFMDYEDHWKTKTDENGNFLRTDEYYALKEKVAKILIERVSKELCPELKKHILFYELATPVTHWRYTGNKNGTIMGARPGKENMQAKIAHYQTPVKNLILGGHWAELGGGVPIAVRAGTNAALIIMKKNKPKQFQLLSTYIDGKISKEEASLHLAFEPYPSNWISKPTPAQKGKQNKTL